MSPRLRILLAVLVLALVAVVAVGAGSTLSVERLLRSRDTLLAWRAQQPLLMAMGYLLCFVLAFGLMLPLGTVFTLAGGAIFGAGWGLLLASFGSSIGSLLSFLGARYLLSDLVGRRLGDRLTPIRQGFERDGAWYLAALRLLPLLPPLVINPAMGLTHMRAGTYYLVTQVAGLPITFLYVYAGTQLVRVNTAQDVLSPGVLLALGLLALSALLARRVLRRRPGKNGEN